ncbi:LRR receptor-like serine threonine-protein kinase [Seminavis robusta]|uniref:LRR receptor-like serine threonine-protein kinase n=1 Tax=Seminavis robusta TaxID=568900 RepID=A0A9N8HYI8_9STRA|nr:LRR receptor-like serine threonine-protein kinase [Seminavis robusta]|eukprot:Sro2903_g339900.1 LRR receptor-like serine threonine-protein kinase (651) ;mRNA; r:7327-9279
MKDRSNAKVELSQAMEHEYPSRRNSREEEKWLAQEGFEDVVDVDDIMTRTMKSGTNTNTNTNTNNGARPSVQVDIDEFILLAGQPAPIPDARNQNEGTPKEAQPGAYRHVGPGYRPASVHSESSDGESCPSPSPLAVDDTSLISSNQTNHQLPLITTDASLPLDGLVQANPVVEESSDEIVVTRQQAILVDDLESQNQTRKKEERKTKTRNQLGLLAFLMVLLVVFVIVVIVVTSKNGDQARVDDNIEVQSSKNDTMPATEHNDDNDVFPVISPYLSNVTRHVIEQERHGGASASSSSSSSSPQYRAYRWLQDDPWKQNYTTLRLVQRFALATLYYATDGDQWENHGVGGMQTVDYREFETPRLQANLPGPIPPNRMTLTVPSEKWLSYNTSECMWFTYTPFRFQAACNEDHVFQYLDLPRNGLRGTLPEEIGLLTGLQSFHFYRNEHIQGPIPTSIGALQQLQTIELGDNQITGTLPSELGLLPNVVKLRVMNNQLHGPLPTELLGMSNLVNLMIDRNELSGNFFSSNDDMICQSWPKLRAVIVGRNKLEGPLPTLANCSSLGAIHFDNQHFVGTIPAAWGSLTNLERIILVGNQGISGPLPNFERLTNLTDFKVAGTSISGTIPDALCARKVGFDCSAQLCGCDCPCN